MKFLRSVKGCARDRNGNDIIRNGFAVTALGFMIKKQ